jgi:hypothetical protein
MLAFDGQNSRDWLRRNTCKWNSTHSTTSSFDAWGCRNADHLPSSWKISDQKRNKIFYNNNNNLFLLIILSSSDVRDLFKRKIPSTELRAVIKKVPKFFAIYFIGNT